MTRLRALLAIPAILAAAAIAAPGVAASPPAHRSPLHHSATNWPTALTSTRALVAGRHDQLPLHFGSAGRRVAAIQYLLRDPRPRQNVFTKIKGTYRGEPSGYFGTRTFKAIIAYKWRLGYPAKWVKPVAGAYFFALLQDRAHRPASWVLNAANRLRAVQPGATKLALAIKAYEISQLGVHEQPWGSNDGPQVRVYQADTGAYRAAWCVSMQQHSFRVGGYGHFADDTAGVYYAVDYYARRSLVFAKPKVGALVAFITYDRYGHRVPGTGHIGFVTKVTATGYSYISGNSSNAVNERYYALGARPAVFLYLPHVATP